MKRFLLVVLVMSIALMSGCSSSDVNDQIANVTQADDEHVLGVKNGYPNSYPNIKYGDAFDEFFESPTWKYFVGTKEGPDDDGDGKPDYVEENVDVVEFTGYCIYKDVKVKALIQFTLNDDNTFDASFLSLNEIPQDYLTLYALITKVFDAYIEKNNITVEDSVNDTAYQNEENLNNNNNSNDNSTNVSAVDNNEYKKFMDWVGSYEEGWMDTILDFELYSSVNQDGECGYILANFRGNEEKGAIYYIGDDKFEWDVYQTIYYVRPDITQDGNNVLTIYDSNDVFDCTFLSSEGLSQGYEENYDVYVIVAAPDGYVNFRTGPGTDYDIITPIYNGAELLIIGDTSANWLNVMYIDEFGNARYGYVNRTQIKFY